ncbi:hypothetical protein IJ556_07785 [bacterium]|nr:hypothetical protein [bacterium]
MKSVIGTIVIFIGIYVIVRNDILAFFAQDSFFIFALCSIVIMLIVAVTVLGLPKFGKRGEHDDT